MIGAYELARIDEIWRVIAKARATGAHTELVLDTAVGIAEDAIQCRRVGDYDGAVRHGESVTDLLWALKVGN